MPDTNHVDFPDNHVAFIFRLIDIRTGFSTTLFSLDEHNHGVDCRIDHSSPKPTSWPILLCPPTRSTRRQFTKWSTQTFTDDEASRVATSWATRLRWQLHQSVLCVPSRVPPFTTNWPCVNMVSAKADRFISSLRGSSPLSDASSARSKKHQTTHSPSSLGGQAYSASS